MIILLYLIFNIVCAAFSIPAGILSDRIEIKIVISVEHILFGFMCLGFAFLKIATIFLFIVYGIFMSMKENVKRAFVSDLTISELRATGLDIFHTFVGIATFPVSLEAGLLWQFFWGRFNLSLWIYDWFCCILCDDFNRYKRNIKKVDWLEEVEKMDLVTLFFVGIIVLIILGLSIRIVKQYERGVVFRLGKVIGVRDPGLRLIIPLIDRMVKVSLRIVTMPIPSQKIITQDNVSINVAAVAYFKVVDALNAVIVIENYNRAVNQIAQTTVRNVIGQFVLDEVLSSTAKINDKIKEIIDAHSEPWGIKVTAVEIKDIKLPETMQRAMAKQAEAEREKRAKIITAEGEYLSAAKLGDAADVIAAHPVALQLRNLQVLSEIATEKNSTIVFPAQFMSSIKDIKEFLEKEVMGKGK